MKRLLPVSLLVVLLFSVPALAEDGVTVMTRNMYFGADLTPAIAATTVPALILAATHIFAVVNASDVPSRVDGMAAEIAKARPDLVGLQEVAIWRAAPCTHRRSRRPGSIFSSSTRSRRAASITSSSPPT